MNGRLREMNAGRRVIDECRYVVVARLECQRKPVNIEHGNHAARSKKASRCREDCDWVFDVAQQRMRHDRIERPLHSASWPGFEATVKVASTQCEIRVSFSRDGLDHTSVAILNGSHIDSTKNKVRVPLDGGTHRLSLNLIRPASRAGPKSAT
jgi:hypothetical protein